MASQSEKNTDREALIALIILLLLIKDDSDGLRIDTDIGTDVIRDAAVGGGAYLAARKLIPKLITKAPKLAPLLRFIASPVGAMVFAAIVVYVVLPRLTGKKGGGIPANIPTGPQAPTAPMPCGITPQMVCGAAGLDSWRIETVDGKRVLVAVCKTGAVTTTDLFEGCK